MEEPLLLNKTGRDALWRKVTGVIEQYIENISNLSPSAVLDPDAIRACLKPYDFALPQDPLETIDFVVKGLWKHQTHTPHPRYFGLFNPAPTTMGIAGETLAAAFNPQLAAWSHSPFAVEIEHHLVLAFAEQFGYSVQQAGGSFCTGGAEANHTALITALIHQFPTVRERGLQALPARPVLYVSSESHHSIAKATRLCGLGTEAIRQVPLDGHLRMDVNALSNMIRQDRENGLLPFFVAGTVATTNAGMIDPLSGIADVCERERLWFHADAAWGGAVVVAPELRPIVEGIDRADSITFDPHKWFSVPLSAGLFLTRHPELLTRVFGIDNAYMPRDAVALNVIDPYAQSMQWTRRFIGLKVFLSLAVAGWDGYAAVVRHMIAMGDYLREALISDGWGIANETPLPVICFSDGTYTGDHSSTYLESIARDVVRSGQAWMSTTRLAGRTVLRACITNFRTEPGDVLILVHSLRRVRDESQQTKSPRHS